MQQIAQRFCRVLSIFEELDMGMWLFCKVLKHTLYVKLYQMSFVQIIAFLFPLQIKYNFLSYYIAP